MLIRKASQARRTFYSYFYKVTLARDEVVLCQWNGASLIQQHSSDCSKSITRYTPSELVYRLLDHLLLFIRCLCKPLSYHVCLCKPVKFFFSIRKAGCEYRKKLARISRDIPEIERRAKRHFMVDEQGFLICDC